MPTSTININFIQQPETGDFIGYTITNNGIPITYPSGADYMMKTFVSGQTISRNRITKLDFDLNNDSAFLDTSINPIFTGASGTVLDILPLPDGNAIIAGQFTQYNTNVSKVRLAKINGNTGANIVFGDPGPVGGLNSFNNTVTTLGYVPSTQSIIAAGNFTAYNGVTRNRILRFASNGLVSSAQNYGTGFNASVSKIAIQPSDEKIVAVGSFTRYNSASDNAQGVVRISATGTYDSTFDSNIGSGSVFAKDLVINPTTGKITIVGTFNGGFNGVNHHSITRRNSNGTEDTAFTTNVGTGFNFGGLGYGLAEVVAEDFNTGKIYVGGVFETYQGTPVSNLVRLNSDGTHDTSFAPVFSPSGSSLNTIHIDADSNIYVGGDFTSVNGELHNKIVKLDQSGNTISIGGYSNGFNSTVESIVQNGANLLVGGAFTNFIQTAEEDEFHVLIGTGLTDTQANVYTSLTTYNTNANVSYSSVGTTIIVTYTYADGESIALTEVFDIPDHIEISSDIDILGLVSELMVRSPHLLISDIPVSFDTVYYDIRIWEGNVNDGPAQPIAYNKIKQKLVVSQNNVYINVSNIVREKLEADISGFLTGSTYTGTTLSMNESKWVQVDSTNSYTGTTSTASTVNTYFILDGYLENNEQQGMPPVLKTGTNRYMYRNSTQKIYFRTRGLQSAGYFKSSMPSTYIPLNFSGNSSENIGYVKSVLIDNYDPADKWVKYIFNYGDAERSAPHIYYLYDECKYKNYDLVFKNKYGVLESISMSKKSTKLMNVDSDDYVRSIVDFNGNYNINRHTAKQFNVRGTEEWTLNTEYIPEYMVEPLKEAMLSEEMWIINNREGLIIPVIRMDQKLDYKTVLNDKLIQYTVKVKLSHTKIKNIL